MQNKIDLNKTELRLAVMLVKEGDYIVAYCPALELSTHGENEQEAKEFFEDAVNEFLKDTMESGTLERCLLEYGWSLKKGEYEPPRIEEKIDFSQYHDYKIISERITLPEYA